MGRDKALVTLKGRPLLVRLLERVGDGAAERILVTNHPASQTAVLEKYRWDVQHADQPPGPVSAPCKRTVRVVTDRRPGLGPVAGLEVGLRVSVHPVCFVVACDMPFVTGALVQALMKEFRSIPSPGTAGKPRALLPLTDGRIQPLCGLYEGACWKVARDCLERGRRSMNDCVHGLDVSRIRADRLLSPDRVQQTFFNINDPADLKRARHWVEEPGPGPG